MNVKLLQKIAFLFLFRKLVWADTGMKDIPQVTVSQGTLQGKVMVSANGKEFYGFLGIPYAKPPVKNLRFQDPQSPENWEGVLDATEDGEICLQYHNIFTGDHQVTGSEDCLYLNIFTPQMPTRDNFPMRSVMVWIHGGAWICGSGHSSFYGPQKFMDYDVVLVVINYRLGAFGFLSTEDEHAPGNYGMKDQVQALRWVQKNIAAFGGDPNSVTIFGESAGGASVEFHLLSPHSKGLFHRAISQSGSVFNPWALIENPQSVSKKHASHIGCPVETNELLMSCLRRKNGSEIALAEKIHFKWHLEPLTRFGPRIDGDFLPDSPATLLKQRKFTNVPYIMGTNKDEGAIKVSGYVKQGILEDFSTNYDQIAPHAFDLEEVTSDALNVARKIREFYFGEQEIGYETTEELVKLFSDRLCFHGAAKSRKLFSSMSEASVYIYNLTYRGQFSFAQLQDPQRDYGVSHVDDLYYLFTNKIFPAMGDEDKLMSHKILKMWTDFAKSGNPTPVVTSDINVKWLPVRPSHPLYLRLHDPLSMESDVPQERTAFWDSLSLNENGEGMGGVGRYEL